MSYRDHFAYFCVACEAEEHKGSLSNLVDVDHDERMKLIYSEGQKAIISLTKEIKPLSVF